MNGAFFAGCVLLCFTLGDIEDPKSWLRVAGVTLIILGVS